MRTLEETMQMMGGPFLYIQALLFILILILGVLKFLRYFGSRGPVLLPFHRSHHAILFLGIFSFAWGAFTQLIGIVIALNEIIKAADISPALVLLGLRNSFISPVFGFGTLILAALIWGILHARYTASIKMQDQSL
jgi:hypothetical protein